MNHVKFPVSVPGPTHPEWEGSSVMITDAGKVRVATVHGASREQLEGRARLVVEGLNKAPAALSWRLDDEFPGRAWPEPSTAIPRIGPWELYVYAIRVDRNPDGMQVAWMSCFQEELEHVQGLLDCAAEEQSLPGLRGDWVLCVTSFAR